MGIFTKQTAISFALIASAATLSAAYQGSYDNTNPQGFNQTQNEYRSNSTYNSQNPTFDRNTQTFQNPNQSSNVTQPYPGGYNQNQGGYNQNQGSYNQTTPRQDYRQNNPYNNYNQTEGSGSSTIPNTTTPNTTFRRSFQDDLSENIQNEYANPNADAEITKRINNALVHASLSTKGRNVQVYSKDGNVTLKGTVETEDEKNQVEAIVRQVVGVKAITNKLVVSK